jgi:hypothetical protein
VEGKIEEVQGEEAEHVHVEGGGVHVVEPQLGGVSLEHSILQISCTVQINQYSLPTIDILQYIDWLRYLLCTVCVPAWKGNDCM